MVPNRMFLMGVRCFLAPVPIRKFFHVAGFVRCQVFLSLRPTGTIDGIDVVTIPKTFCRDHSG